MEEEREDQVQDEIDLEEEEVQPHSFSSPSSSPFESSERGSMNDPSSGELSSPSSS
jgi:hypothetical protein